MKSIREKAWEINQQYWTKKMKCKKCQRVFKLSEMCEQSWNSPNGYVVKYWSCWTCAKF